MPPHGFSWVDRPHIAALAYPHGVEELIWLREQGIEVLISLTEDAVPRRWVNEAGLMLLHVPISDMDAPTESQLQTILTTIDRANGRGVAVHCAAGRGRTGTVLAAYFVAKGVSADNAIQKVRSLRPGSIETQEQESAIRDFARRKTRHEESK